MASGSLIEMMVSLSLGALLSGSLFQSLIGELQNGQRLTRLLRERPLQRRSLELIETDVSRADRISRDPLHELHACSLAGRLPVLHLSTSAGPITYSIGSAPSPIWRGQVLMRCGPAFGLDGRWSSGSQAQNRVVLDGLAAHPARWSGCQSLLGEQPTGSPPPIDLAGSANRSVSACYAGEAGLLGMRIEQEFPVQHSRQIIQAERLIGAP